MQLREDRPKLKNPVDFRKYAQNMRRSTSSESLDWPWNNRRRRTQKVVVVSQNEHEGFTFESFLLCFVAVFLLASGMMLLVTHIWFLIRMRLYVRLLQVTVDLPYFSIPAAVLYFPSAWVAVGLHNSEKKAKLLPLLIIFLVISTSLLVTAPCVGILLRRTEYSTDNKTTTTHGLTSISLHEINATIYSIILDYDKEDARYKAIFDQTQQTLNCCGSRSKSDFTVNGIDVPSSCCPQNKCDPSYNNTFERGCADSLTRQFGWHQNVLSSLNWASICVAAFATVMSSAIYCSLIMPPRPR